MPARIARAAAARSWITIVYTQIRNSLCAQTSAGTSGWGWKTPEPDKWWSLCSTEIHTASTVSQLAVRLFLTAAGADDPVFVHTYITIATIVAVAVALYSHQLDEHQIKLLLLLRPCPQTKKALLKLYCYYSYMPNRLLLASIPIWSTKSTMQ